MGHIYYREGTKLAKRHLMPFILSQLGPYSDGGTGKLSPWTFLIAPKGAQSMAVESGGLHSQNVQHPQSALFLSKQCPFKVNHAPFLLRERKFSSTFKSLNANVFALTGHSYYREGTKWAKGHLYALMGHLSGHIWALIATAEPNNYCPREPFSLPLKGHSQGRWNQGAGGSCTPKISTPQNCPFFLSKKCHFKSKTCPFFGEEKDRFRAQLYREGTKLTKGHLYAL